MPKRQSRRARAIRRLQQLHIRPGVRRPRLEPERPLWRGQRQQIAGVRV